MKFVQLLAYAIYFVTNTSNHFLSLSHTCLHDVANNPFCRHYFPVVECHMNDVTPKGCKGTGPHTVVVELCTIS